MVLCPTSCQSPPTGRNVSLCLKTSHFTHFMVISLVSSSSFGIRNYRFQETFGAEKFQSIFEEMFESARSSTLGQPSAQPLWSISL